MKMVWGLAAVALWAMCPDAHAQQAQTTTAAQAASKVVKPPAERTEPSRTDRIGAAFDGFLGWVKDNTDASPEAFDHGGRQAGGGGGGRGGGGSPGHK
jgi:hypothetical protein